MPAYLRNWQVSILTHLETIYFSCIKADETVKYCAEFVHKIINKETKTYLMYNV